MTTTYSCREIINTQNLNRILKAKKIDHDTIVGLRKLKRRLGKSNQHEVSFCLSNDGENPGRLYPKRGAMCLQSLKKDVRKALTYDTYTDIDMTNAHPTILSQLFKKHDIACPKLDKYISERENLLAETGMPRNEAKQAFIQLMYGGKPRPNATPFMVDFHKEIISNAERILALPENHKYKDMGEMKKPSNALGSALGYLAQDIERECVMTMVKTFTTEGYEVSTIIHDGFLVQSLDVKDEVLRSAEQSVKHLNGYDIKLEKKDLTNFDETNLWGDDADGQDVADGTNETQMARLFLDWLDGEDHNLVYHEKKYYWFDPKLGVYRDDFRQLRIKVEECPELPEDKRGKGKFQDDIIKQVKALLDEDDRFGFKLVETTYGKIPFKNGVYDVVSGELIDYNRDMFFTKRGTLNYKPQSEELKKEVYDKIFLGVFGTEEKADYMLKSLARTMAGDINDKLFFIVRGRTNSGKGVLTEAVFQAFYTIYGGFSAGNLCEKRNDGDTAKMNSWKVHLRTSRFAVANEKTTKALDAEAMKMCASGGDPLTARQNYQDETTFVLQCLFWLFCNDPPQFVGLDEAGCERLRVITTAYKYLLPDKYEAIKNEKGEVPDYVRKADEDVKKVWLKREDIQQAFAQLVCESWEDKRPECPQCILDDTNMYLSEASDEAKIAEHIIETGKSEDKLSLPQLLMMLKKDDNIDLSISTLKSKLSDMGLTKFKREMNSEGKKIYYLYGAKIARNEDPLPFTTDDY